MHRPTSGPATNHPLPSQRSEVALSGISTSNLLRRASMPTDSLQLYHPLSLQSLPHSGSGTIGTDPYLYHTSSSRRYDLESAYVGGRSSSVVGNYRRHSGGAGTASFTFPTPASRSVYNPQHQPGYSVADHYNTTYVSSHEEPLAGYGFYSQQQHQQHFSGGHQYRRTPTPTSASESDHDSASDAA